MENLSSQIIELMQSVSYPIKILILSIFSFAEGLPVIGSVLPGGTIALLAGGLSSSGALINPFVVSLVVGTTGFLGDMVGFFLGRKFKNISWVSNLVTHEKYKKSWDLFDRHLAIVTIFGKLLPVIRSTPSLFAAVKGVKTRRYMFYSLIGSYLWGFAGVYAGNIFTKYLGPKFIGIVLAILIISILIIIIRALIKSKKPA
jgi:membrane protein DedA with SNARE-associated domain